jgi:predicted ribosomally synthesized peptide with nif11-like leader
MANDHITALIDRVKHEPDLQSRFGAVGSAAEACAIAAELGFEISTDEIIEFVSDIELNDAQLEVIAGGMAPGDGDDVFFAGIIDAIKKW